MALEPSGTDPLEQARRLIRDERPTGWQDVSEGVLRRLRSISLPAEQLRVHTEDGRRLAVSARVLLPSLRRAIDDEHRVVEDIELHTEGGRLVGLDLQLVCRFDSDLRAQGRDAWERVVEVVEDLLGRDPELDTHRDLRVSVVDVVSGDPRLS